MALQVEVRTVPVTVHLNQWLLLCTGLCKALSLTRRQTSTLVTLCSLMF